MPTLAVGVKSFNKQAVGVTSFNKHAVGVTSFNKHTDNMHSSRLINTL